jgi:hypothetical protein
MQQALDVGCLFADRRIVSTIAVAAFLDISEDVARGWAWALHVTRVRGAFAWTKDDAEQLISFLTVEHEDSPAA